jgi:hypothetical protein
MSVQVDYYFDPDCPYACELGRGNRRRCLAEDT